MTDEEVVEVYEKLVAIIRHYGWDQYFEPFPPTDALERTTVSRAQVLELIDRLGRLVDLVPLLEEAITSTGDIKSVVFESEANEDAEPVAGPRVERNARAANARVEGMRGALVELRAQVETAG
ncbi:hypothetical protein [Devosia aurantiaca]|uniref:Uncharacterized protein n=1 Tax=Devosia aurantiaca TaxID=2714858 RepID=A0A6M1SPY1_9HYPH|nr:hypothetical protein [Devosia aurantiaca]NGP16523.1 hypothetical protein [Devosia aurantiaca]